MKNVKAFVLSYCLDQMKNAVEHMRGKFQRTSERFGYQSYSSHLSFVPVVFQEDGQHLVIVGDLLYKGEMIFRISNVEISITL